MMLKLIMMLMMMLLLLMMMMPTTLMNRMTTTTNYDNEEYVVVNCNVVAAAAVDDDTEYDDDDNGDAAEDNDSTCTMTVTLMIALSCFRIFFSCNSLYIDNNPYLYVSNRHPPMLKVKVSLLVPTLTIIRPLLSTLAPGIIADTIPPRPPPLIWCFFFFIPNFPTDPESSVHVQ